MNLTKMRFQTEVAPAAENMDVILFIALIVDLVTHQNLIKNLILL